MRGRCKASGDVAGAARQPRAGTRRHAESPRSRPRDRRLRIAADTSRPFTSSAARSKCHQRRSPQREPAGGGLETHEAERLRPEARDRQTSARGEKVGPSRDRRPSPAKVASRQAASPVARVASLGSVSGYRSRSADRPSQIAGARIPRTSASHPFSLVRRPRKSTSIGPPACGMNPSKTARTAGS